MQCRSQSLTFYKLKCLEKESCTRLSFSLQCVGFDLLEESSFIWEPGAALEPQVSFISLYFTAKKKASNTNVLLGFCRIRLNRTVGLDLSPDRRLGVVQLAVLILIFLNFPNIFTLPWHRSTLIDNLCQCLSSIYNLNSHHTSHIVWLVNLVARSFSFGPLDVHLSADACVVPLFSCVYLPSEFIYPNPLNLCNLLSHTN